MAVNEKINISQSQTGKMGEKLLAKGDLISMRYWDEEPYDNKDFSIRDYETVGYVIEGKAELEFENNKILLTKGDSWVVPKSEKHRYKVLEHFVAVEATAK